MNLGNDQGKHDFKSEVYDLSAKLYAFARKEKASAHVILSAAMQIVHTTYENMAPDQKATVKNAIKKLLDA